MISKLFALCCVLLIHLTSSTLLAAQHGLFYYEVEGAAVKITGYAREQTGYITIPSEIEGLPVTSISTYAFYGQDRLTGISLPNTLKTIEAEAFYGCSGFTSITIPSSVTFIGESAFEGCLALASINVEQVNLFYSSINGVLFNAAKNALLLYPNGKTETAYTIPDGVVVVGASAFHGCTHLTNITIPDGVTTIQDSAFHSCSSLETIILPSGLSQIGKGAFDSCSRITSISIPDSVTSIGAEAFYDCDGLTNFTIPQGVTTLSNGLFWECSGLIKVTIAAGITVIEDGAFGDCGNLEEAVFLGDAPQMGEWVFDGVAPNFMIIYLGSSTGFTAPTWSGYPSQMVNTSIYPAARWLLLSNLPYNTNLNQDLNGDGVSLLMAYALNKNPTESLTNQLPTANLNGNTLSLKYYGGSEGIAYQVKFSKDLIKWETAEVSISSADFNGMITASVDPDGACGFLRLVVTEE